LEFAGFYLVTVYTPNARRDLSRLEFRVDWEERFRSYLQQLDAHKPVIICGDLNVAHQEIDIKNWKSNVGSSGFTPEEREKMTQLLDAGFIDSFRHLYPEKTDAYTWWSNMPGVRERNVGWRIDYFIASSRLSHLIVESKIDQFIIGSDHCPIILEIADMH
jgi:exodeoxyribonuclease-3